MRTLTRSLLLTLALSLPTLATQAHAENYNSQCFDDGICFGSDDRGNNWTSQSFGNRRDNQTFFSDDKGTNCTQQCFNGTCFTSCD